MKSSDKDGELEKLLKETSDDDPLKTAANAEVLALFRRTLAVPAGAKERVSASLGTGADAPRRTRAPGMVPALALCAVAMMVVILLRPARAPEAETSPDWRSYENFPYYADETAMYISDIPPDWRNADNLVPGADPVRGL